MDKKCKVCGKKIEHEGAEFLKSRLYVVVDERVQRATIMNKGDNLCAVCHKTASFYQRIRE